MFAFIDNIKINIKDYKEKIKENNDLKDKKILDENGNEMEFIKSKKNKFKSHFRLKPNNNDNSMTLWHKNWENIFSFDSEKCYKHDDMIKKNRRADVDLNETTIIEFQNSKIEKIDVDNRKKDWTLVNKKIIWVINGNNSIMIEELKNSKRIFIEFINDIWKYESFKSYEEIYIDVKDNIYKINPNNVKSNMIDVQNPISKEMFIDKLKKKEEIFEKDEIFQTNIYVKQNGAGNGKTYGIVQLIQDDDFNHYDTFIYLTKQHSAVNVINEEIEDQQKRGLLDNIEFVDKIVDNKKHKIIVKNKNNNKIKNIIIATFDSFIYALGDKQKEGCNKFIEMANSIIDDELRCSKNGNIKYASKNITLNKKLLLIGDEMQDLSIEYIKAIIKITRDRYVDFYGVGDLLQSISIEKNSFDFLYNNELPKNAINVKKYEPINICRRFNDIKLIKFVNSMVPFNKYNLKSIKSIEPNNKTNNEADNDNCLKIINGKSIYSNERNNDKIEKEINKIMKCYIKEVEENKLSPNDFLIITPFTSKNPFVDTLNTEIRNYWKKKYNDDKYIKYSYFHKSETGTSIDLNISKNSTRIVSIHSSKGDGRPVVFVIGLTEHAIRIFSNEKDNLIYDSMIHVALTRMKKRLYIRLENNNDDIHRKITNFLKKNNIDEDIIPEMKILKKIKLKTIFSNIQKQNNYYNICNDKIIKFTKYGKFIETEKKQKELIDMKHHCIRFVIFCSILDINILNENKNENEFKKQQLFQIINNFINKKIEYIDDTKDYYSKLYDDNYNEKNIPILVYGNNKGDYFKYTNILKDNIKNIRKKIKNFIEKNKNIELTKLETIILFFLIELSDKGKYSIFPISDLYDIIDIYEKSEKTEKEKYIQTHYNDLEFVNCLYNKINNKYNNLKWLYNHTVIYNGNTEHYKISNKFNYIAYNNDILIIFYIKPQFSSLNYNETILENIFDIHLIQNIKKETKNYKRFLNKKIISYVLTFDDNEPYLIDWNISTNKNLIFENDKIIKDILKENIYNEYKKYNDNIYLFFKYYFNKFKNKEPIKIIKNIENEYSKVKDNYIGKYVEYIDELFKNIKFLIKNKSEEDKLEIINRYINKDYFIEEINSLIKETIKDFLDCD